MSKPSEELIEVRRGWLIPAIFAGVGLLIGGAAALGFQTPAAQISKIATRVDDHDAKLSDHDKRIQRLEDAKETIENIARAVGAPIKRTR